MSYGREVFILDFTTFRDSKLIGERTIVAPDDDHDRLERAHVARDEHGDFIFVSFDAEASTSQYIGYGNGIAHVLNKPTPYVDGPLPLGIEPIDRERRFDYSHQTMADRVIVVVGFPSGWSANHFNPWPTDVKHVNQRLAVKFDLFKPDEIHLKWQLLELGAGQTLGAEVGRIKRHETGSASEKSLVLFIHGLGGKGEETWDKFPELLLQDDEFARRYAIGFFSYPTMLVRTIFNRKAPSIQELAAGLRTQIENRYAQFLSVVLVCHSLGGLIARKYLLDEFKAKRRTRVKGIVLFAVPNNGADLAGVANAVSWRHHQVRQLCRGSDLIELLNEDWFTMGLPEVVRAKYVTGTQDHVVDRFSAKGTWGNPDVETVIGKGHIDIVKPQQADDDVILILKRFLKSLSNKKTNTMNAAPQSAPTVGEKLEHSSMRASDSLVKLTVIGTCSNEKLQSAQPWREIDHCRFRREFEVAADPVFDLMVENTSGGSLVLLKTGIRILERKPGTGGVLGVAQPIKVQAEYSVHCHEDWKRFNLNENESWARFEVPLEMKKDNSPFRFRLCLENFCDTESASSSEIRFCLQTSSGTVESESIWLEQ
jgi:pimeloyl-ACP methyl ester carboxylesterase